MGGLGPHRVSHCRSPALHCIFIPQSEKRERAGGVVLVEGGLSLCVQCVCQCTEEGGGGYTVVLFPSALILLS